MKRPVSLFIPLILLLLSISSATISQVPIWGFRIGSNVTTYGEDVGYSCKVTPAGNFVVAGKFSGTMDLDPGAGVYNISSNGRTDIFLACYSSTGGFLWGFNIGGPNNDGAYEVAVDNANNVIIGGFYQSAGIDFDPGASVSTIPFAGGTSLSYEGDGFVAKYSATGTFQWARQLGGITVYDYTEALGTDANNNVYVGGEFNSTMTLAGGPVLSTAVAGPAYLIKYKADGSLVWAHNFGQIGTAGVDCVVMDMDIAGANIYFCGLFRGTSDFHPWGTPEILVATGGSTTAYDPYIAKFDTDGNFVFVKQIASDGVYDIANNIALDASENIYVSGFSGGSSITFDPASPGTSTFSLPGGTGNNDMFMAKYDQTGAYQWGMTGGAAGDDRGNNIDVSGSTLYFTGQFTGSVDFDPSPGIASMTSSGGTDVFVAKYDLDGHYQCGFRAGGSNDDADFGLTHDVAGDFYITGQFGGTSIDFDPSSSTLPLTALAGSDIQIVKYEPECLVTMCGTLDMPDTMYLCINDTGTIPATLTGVDSILSVRWHPPTILSDTTILTPVVTASASGYEYVTIRSLVPYNLVVNGDFEGGNYGFSSSYTYSPPPSTTLFEGHYSIATDPHSVHTGFTIMGDHTTGTGSMMIINGASSAVDVWCQTIPVSPGTDYNFSAWFANCSSVTTGPNVPVIQFRINGTLLGTATTVTATPGTWVPYATTWNSGTNTSATICIYDATTAASGNDFAIDDIVFQKICTIEDSIYVQAVIPDTTGEVSDTSLCASELPIPLTAPTGYTNYLWSTGSTSSTTINATTAGVYWVSATLGCSVRTDTFNVVTYPNPVVNLGSDTGFCIGNMYILSSSQPTGTTFLWNTGSTLDSVHVSVGGTYSLAVTDTNGCSASDIITIMVSPPPIVDLGPDTVNCLGAAVPLSSSGIYTSPAYYWNTGSMAPTITATLSGTYWLRVTDGGCAATDTINVGIRYDTFTLWTPDTAICMGRNVQVRTTADPGLNFQWVPTAGIALSTSPSPLITPDTSAMYVVKVSADGCPDRFDSFYLDVQPIPVPFLGTTKHVCLYDTVQLHAIVSPTWYSNYAYSWSPSTYLDHDDIRDVVFTAGDFSTMVVTVTTPAGCKGIDSVVIVIHPVNFATISPDTSICPNDSVQIVATGGQFYKWTPGMYLSSDTSSQPWVHAITSQDYTMIATSDYGCKDTLTTAVNVYPDAVINIADSTVLYPGESYQIIPQTNCTKFLWSPAVGLSNRYLSDPIASPQVSTRYIVNGLTENGCKTTDSINVVVKANSIISLPNAFAPGSGSDNRFRIIRRGIVHLNYFRIYNRWGNLVFDGENIDDGWDGTYKGVPQDMGVFVYTAEAVTSTGEVIQLKGNVTLLR